jgi:hypothetical protein
MALLVRNDYPWSHWFTYLVVLNWNHGKWNQQY